MILSAIQDLETKQHTFKLPYVISNLNDVGGQVIINNKSPILVENISDLYNNGSDIIIEDPYKNDIGVLCFLKNKTFDIDSLNEYQFTALLLDVDDENDLKGTDYRFNNNYVIIDEAYYLNYQSDYQNSSPLWGLFNHNLKFKIPSPNTLTPSKLQATNLSNFNHEYYYECSIRGIKQSYGFERYLKYYHLLELNFDYDVVRRIKAIDITKESNEIGKLLNEYEQDDISRLLYLFETYCKDIPSIVNKLNAIKNYEIIANEIFYKFGKRNSNPLKDINAFGKFLSSPDLFSFSNCKTFHGISSPEQYNLFIGKLTMYWIYRVRCSIAHNKIGEYLMSVNDESFITFFAFPLLNEVIMQCFK